MKVKELRNLSDDELVQKERDLKKEVFDLTYERQMGPVQKPSQFKNNRRTIARIQTILEERASDGKN